MKEREKWEKKKRKERDVRRRREKKSFALLHLSNCFSFCLTLTTKTHVHRQIHSSSPIWHSKYRQISSTYFPTNNTQNLNKDPLKLSNHAIGYVHSSELRFTWRYRYSDISVHCISSPPSRSCSVERLCSVHTLAERRFSKTV